MGLIPGWGIMIPHAVWCSQKKLNEQDFKKNVKIFKICHHLGPYLRGQAKLLSDVVVNVNLYIL